MDMAAALRLEHRLTKIEAAIVANTDQTERLAGQVEKQNGRVGKLEDKVDVEVDRLEADAEKKAYEQDKRMTQQERFQLQVLTLVGALGFVSPLVFGFVFFFLNKQFGG